ncbi:MAG: M14 family metallocarboxypeptidase [archaeon]|nr:M14 family metallocarboxypeptidase [archaeon]
MGATNGLSFSEDYFSQHEGETVQRVHFADAGEKERLVAWAGYFELDVWRVSAGPVGSMDVRMGAGWEHLLKLLPDGLSAEVLVDDIEARMRDQLFPHHHQEEDEAEENEENKEGMERTDPGFFLSYHTYEEIVSFLEDQQQEYPQFVRVFEFGTTADGNAIMAVNIRAPGDQPLQEIVFNGGIHAREWIAPATMTYLIHYLTEALADGGNPLASQYSWTIVPVLNVDGYLWTWSNSRMWRKNRRQVSPKCIGVDNNRNFPFHWGITAGGESSSDPCSDAYHGPSAASELETQALIGYWEEHHENILAYFDIHAYGELWLTPWGYTFARPPLDDFWLQNNSSSAAVHAIYQVHRQSYTNGEGAATIYPTSGDTTDTSYGVYGIVYSQTIELRGPSRSAYGFLLPANQIIPQGQEFVAGVNAAVTFMSRNAPSKK